MESIGSTLLWVFAEGGSPVWANPMVTMLLPMGLLFYFLIIAPQRRDAAKRRGMLSDLKPNDRVVTVGGIRGVVAKVSRESDEITIKVDESANIKIRFTLSAVSKVEGAESSGKTPAKK